VPALARSAYPGIPRLRQRGVAALVVSHGLDQAFRIADRVAARHRGRRIGVRKIAETTRNEIPR
jgi:ABC-type sugar transport system ATPase subunit